MKPPMTLHELKTEIRKLPLNERAELTKSLVDSMKDLSEGEIEALSGEEAEPRKDGRTFALSPEKGLSSPLDVPSIKADVSTQEIVDIVREGREEPEP